MASNYKILFMGTSEFAVPALKAIHQAGYPVVLVVTQPDKPAGRGMELKASPVKKAAEELGLPVFQPLKVRFPEAVETLQKAAPDISVVAAYGQILPLAVLQIPKIASLNIHGSLLPKYRGAAPIHYAVMNGETETGVTIMHMNEKMDEGDMILAKTTPVGEKETTGEVHDRLSQLGAEGILEVLALMAQGKAPRIPQDPTMASYAPSLKREQCRIDWNKEAHPIVNQVRGLSPWPVAETAWQGMELKVHLAQTDPRNGKPGEILAVEKDGVVVGAGSGSVRLLEIQPPGKKKMNAHDFTLGHSEFKPGSSLL